MRGLVPFGTAEMKGLQNLSSLMYLAKPVSEEFLDKLKDPFKGQRVFGTLNEYEKGLVQILHEQKAFGEYPPNTSMSKAAQIFALKALVQALLRYEFSLRFDIPGGDSEHLFIANGGQIIMEPREFSSDIFWT